MQSNSNANDFPKVTLTAADGAKAEIYLYGAQVTSWCPANNEEQLFLSERAEFCHGTAIRGGIPVCFPQFADEGLLLKHGFARISVWKLLRTEQLGDLAQAVLQLEDSEASRVIWPHAFTATLTVTVGGPSLRLEFSVENTGATPLTFTAALHTYLRVADITTTAVENLAGSYYRDAVTQVRENKHVNSALRFTGEVDRIYSQITGPVRVRTPERDITVTSTGFDDVVLWNPGLTRCAALADIKPTGYQRMVCVEAAAITDPPTVAPGGTWYGTQELRPE
jgi:glucose-6-phosphate 1-epimerase